MKINRFASIATSITLLAVASTPALAAMSAASGWYLEVTGGGSKQQNDSNGSLSSKNVGMAGNGAIGYKFMPYVAGEAGYTQYSRVDLKSGGTLALKNRPYDYHAAIKGIIPIGNSGFEPFAKVGVARLKTKYQVKDSDAVLAAGASSSDKSSTGYYLGAGAQYYFMPELAVVAQWARAHGNSDATGSMDLYSVGLSFIFD